MCHVYRAVSCFETSTWLLECPGENETFFYYASKSNGGKGLFEHYVGRRVHLKEDYRRKKSKLGFCYEGEDFDWTRMGDSELVNIYCGRLREVNTMGGLGK